MQRTAGEVDYWRQRVRQLEEAGLTWGMTKSTKDALIRLEDVADVRQLRSPVVLEGDEHIVPG